MKKSRYTDEQIVTIVRESHAHGVSVAAKKYKVSSHIMQKIDRLLCLVLFANAT